MKKVLIIVEADTESDTLSIQENPPDQLRNLMGYMTLLALAHHRALNI